MPRLIADAVIPHTGQRADIHLPDAVDGARVLVNVHGGGWYTGDKSLATACCAELARRGLVVVNVNYRIPAHDPVPLMVADVLSALAWTATRADLPAGPVALAGDSAGAHLAVLAAQALADPALAAELRVEPATGVVVGALVSWSGALSLRALEVPAEHPEHERFAGYLRTIGRGGVDPIAWLGPQLPRLLAATSARDFFHDSSREFAAAARAAGVDVVEQVFDASHPACTHSWQLDPALPESQENYDLVAAFVAGD